MPPRGDCPEPLLSLVEGISGGRQEAPGRYTARAATSDEIKELRREASALKEVVAELTIENRLLASTLVVEFWADPQCRAAVELRWSSGPTG